MQNYNNLSSNFISTSLAVYKRYEVLYVYVVICAGRLRENCLSLVPFLKFFLRNYSNKSPWHLIKFVLVPLGVSAKINVQKLIYYGH